MKIKSEILFDENLLENYYDDNTWSKFAECFKNIKTKNTKYLLELFDNNIELVNVIEWRTEDSLYWIKAKVPALNNLRPVDCIKDDDLLKRLKVCLLRMD
ncbi:hypothetical protein FACS189475_04140 [Betaproteobacteria bacterium]|nr:hypothetical protein FACS189475_04140 [Betaproteobacteria bacterium]